MKERVQREAGERLQGGHKRVQNGAKRHESSSSSSTNCEIDRLYKNVAENGKMMTGNAGMDTRISVSSKPGARETKQR
jgi:hypothetical protein